jgi:hypothetical protein
MTTSRTWPLKSSESSQELPRMDCCKKEEDDNPLMPFSATLRASGGAASVGTAAFWLRGIPIGTIWGVVLGVLINPAENMPSSPGLLFASVIPPASTKLRCLSWFGFGTWKVAQGHFQGHFLAIRRPDY